MRSWSRRRRNRWKWLAGFSSWKFRSLHCIEYGAPEQAVELEHCWSRLQVASCDLRVAVQRPRVRRDVARTTLLLLLHRPVLLGRTTSAPRAPAVRAPSHWPILLSSGLDEPNRKPSTPSPAPRVARTTHIAVRPVQSWKVSSAEAASTGVGGKQHHS